MANNRKKKRIEEALIALSDLGMPRAQQNERSALCLLALLDLSPNRSWADAKNPLIGITPIMDWARHHYDKKYAPNTRETVRRQTMHQFVQAGIAVYNPDRPDRQVNSPHAVYQIEPGCLSVLRTLWNASLFDIAGKLCFRAWDARCEVCEGPRNENGSSNCCQG